MLSAIRMTGGREDRPMDNWRKLERFVNALLAVAVAAILSLAVWG